MRYIGDLSNELSKNTKRYNDTSRASITTHPYINNVYIVSTSGKQRAQTLVIGPNLTPGTELMI